MRLISKSISLIIILCCFWACNDQFQYYSDSDVERIVVEGIAEVDSSLRIRLSASNQMFSEDTSKVEISNATIRLYVDGRLIEFISQDGSGVYGANYIPRSGDSVRFVVRDDDHPIAICEDVMPRRVDVTLFDTSGRIGNNFDLLLRFIEEPNTNSSYFLSLNSLFYEYELDNQGSIIDSNLVSEPVVVRSANKLFFSESNLINNQSTYQIFSDQLIPSGPYDLSIIVHASDLAVSSQRSKSTALALDFRSISESTYKTLEGLQLNSSVFGGPFSTTNNVLDNIQGGYGLMQFNWNYRDTIYLAQ